MKTLLLLTIVGLLHSPLPVQQEEVLVIEAQDVTDGYAYTIDMPEVRR